MKDYYKILGVKEDATEEEVRSHWIGLTKHYHPDRREGNQDDEKIKVINEAYQVLKFPSTRMAYDFKRSYYRKKKRLHLQRRILPASLFAFVLIIASIFYIKSRSSFLSPSDSPSSLQPSQKTASLRTDEAHRADPIDIPIPSPVSERSAEVEKATPKETKKVMVKDDVKIVPKAPPSPPPKAQGDGKPTEKPSTQIVLKSEPLAKAENVIPKETKKVMVEEDLRIVPKAPASSPTAAQREEKPIEKPLTQVVSKSEPSVKVEKAAPQEITRIVPKAGEVKQIMSTDRKGPIAQAVPSASATLPLLAKEEEVRQFFSLYIDRYTKKNIDGFLSLFSSKAVQNQKDGLEEIKRIYKQFLNQSQELRYYMEDVKIDILPNVIEVKARYELDQQLKKGKEKRSWRGLIRWTLIKEQGALKISSLDYQNQNSP